MRKKRMFALLLALGLLLSLLTGCSGEQGGQAPETGESAEELTDYEHSVGLSMKMAPGFTETDIEGIMAGYEGEAANVRIEAERFDQLEALGYAGEEMTAAEYGQLIRDAYGLEGEVAEDEYGTVFLPYSQLVQEIEVSYYAFFHKGEDAFWTVTFMCFAETADQLEGDFHLWASTVETGPAPAAQAESEA